MITLNSIMNFRIGHEVTDGRLYYKVSRVGKTKITCTRNLRRFMFKASELTIVSCDRSFMAWDDYEIETVGSNLHLSNKELGEMLNRTPGAIKGFKDRTNLKKIA